MSERACLQLALPLDDPGPVAAPASHGRASRRHRRLRPTGEQDLLAFPAGPDELASRLSGLLGREVALTVTDNRRTMISYRQVADRMAVRLHSMFLGAPEPVLSALARWIDKRERAASALLDRFVKENLDEVRKPGRRRTPVRTRGRHHDLGAVLRALDDRFFGGCFDAGITWGRRPTGRRRRTIRLGSYAPDERLIRIHPALDQPFVPDYFVEAVVYHEMLHHVLGVPEGARRRIHDGAFRALERAFPDHERAAAWEKENVGRLLRL